MARKVAVISGASSGIGKETAALLVEAGWRVFAFNRGKADIPGVESVTVDITKTEDIRRGVEAVKQQAGRVDLLVNNAGMGI
nr:SDR family NAD(P)-dependent oxidoreductase [Clostridiales bacterium]